MKKKNKLTKQNHFPNFKFYESILKIISLIYKNKQLIFSFKIFDLIL
jgi:hypothetical protein